MFHPTARAVNGNFHGFPVSHSRLLLRVSARVCRLKGLSACFLGRISCYIQRIFQHNTMHLRYYCVGLPISIGRRLRCYSGRLFLAPWQVVFEAFCTWPKLITRPFSLAHSSDKSRHLLGLIISCTGKESFVNRFRLGSVSLFPVGCLEFRSIFFFFSFNSNRVLVWQF